jgi:hypothetical protein
MISMKTLFYLFISIAIALPSCTKSSSNDLSNAAIVNRWQLVQKNWSLGWSEGVIRPSEDSSVSLILNPDNTYSSLLNGNTVSQGTYSISADTSNFEMDLQLNDFKTTGIFSLFTLYEIGQNGQVISEFDGFFMNISHDTLTLSSVLTPGGNTSYTFAKR